MSPIVIKELDNPNPAASIRVAMRKQESEIPPPAPSIKDNISKPVKLGRWTVAQEGTKPSIPTAQPVPSQVQENENDDTIIQQWNSVQPVISEKEKQLLDQLKGKLKGKTRTESNASSSVNSSERDKLQTARSSSSRRDTTRRRSRSLSRSRSRSRSRGRGGYSSYRRRNSPRGYGGRRRGGRSRSRSLRRRYNLK